MGAILWQMLWLLAINVVFFGILAALLMPIAGYKQAAFAVMKRNFIGYFSNPTGYVFLCLFVLLTSTAAFWPHEFFAANLANLDQLNAWLPWIMLIFIPAITMSIWAEERRQGTDELLLTLPAADFDIVIGKYLAAAATFTVSLVFSQLWNYAILVALTQGELDTGLFFTTYLGYWLIGLAMLAIGMVASFLTNNLTVGFILGLLFNAPLVFLSQADTFIPSSRWAAEVSRWSIVSRFDDFGRGVVSASSTVFFVLVAAIGIYMAIVMIGRRHWSGGRDGESLIGHYLVRFAALVVILIGLNTILSYRDPVRIDLTEGQVSSLSKNTLKLINNVDRKRPVVVDAYMSATVPDEYVKTKYNLISMLKELERRSGGRVNVKLHDNLEAFSEEAATAEERFGIRRQTVMTRARGAIKEEEFILGAAFTCGLEKVVVPFFSSGVPVEYELIRSITIASQGEQDKRKTLGVVSTDAQLNGGFSFAGGQPRQIPRQMILEELERQYKVEEVDATNPIEVGKYDALLVVQPSTLGPQQLSNLVTAVAAGQPTAIFEDPLPVVMGSAVGTNQEKPPQGGMFGMGGQPQPKGDIKSLWNVLQINPMGDMGQGSREIPGQIVWQAYNPYPRFQMRGIGPELVFVSNEAPGAKDAFNPKLPVTAGFEELLMPFPGAIKPALGSKLEFTELVATGNAATGTMEVNEWIANRGNPLGMDLKRGLPTKQRYTLAAWIKAAADDKASSDKAAEKAEGEADEKGKNGKAADKPAARGINCIYVCDIDMLDSQFVMLRNQPDSENNFRFDNVPFVLNVIDSVAGDDRFLQIRTRKPRHTTLRAIEEESAAARAEEAVQAADFEKEYNAAVKAADEESKKNYAKLQEVVDDLRKKQAEGQQVDPGELQARVQSLQLAQEAANRRAEVKKEALQNDRDRELERIQRQRDQRIQRRQNQYKIMAMVFPPIFPLLVGLAVFAYRRVREREGISKSRMKY